MAFCAAASSRSISSSSKFTVSYQRAAHREESGPYNTPPSFNVRRAP